MGGGRPPSGAGRPSNGAAQRGERSRGERCGSHGLASRHLVPPPAITATQIAERCGHDDLAMLLEHTREWTPLNYDFAHLTPQRVRSLLASGADPAAVPAPLVLGYSNGLADLASEAPLPLGEQPSPLQRALALSPPTTVSWRLTQCTHSALCALRSALCALHSALCALPLQVVSWCCERSGG